jgi:uncharacterized protein (TIGR02246 family)
MAVPSENPVRSLYASLLDEWSRRNAGGFARLFTEDGSVVGFDGSQMNGRSEIRTALEKVFADHPTASYVSIVKDVRYLSRQAALLRAVVGMVAPGASDINPAVNAIQSLVAVKLAAGWRIALFHNTPAAFHGRPDLAETLTEENRAELRNRRA